MHFSNCSGICQPDSCFYSLIVQYIDLISGDGGDHGTFLRHHKWKLFLLKQPLDDTVHFLFAFENQNLILLAKCSFLNAGMQCKNIFDQNILLFSSKNVETWLKLDAFKQNRIIKLFQHLHAYHSLNPYGILSCGTQHVSQPAKCQKYGILFPPQYKK